ncbi:MAG: hypothetical protein EOP92_22185 [Lysobacteraceae bacterium]|nr:MAG: hypothetical protein EOP92_22185 [Xanthomonadaceae bacterium]
MNELLCGTGRQGKPTALAHHPQANTISKLDPKHYPETWARVDPEADDAGYVKISQPELPSDQVPTGAGAETCAI